MNGIKKWIAISLFISIVSIVIIMIYTMDSKTIESIYAIRPEFLVLAFCLHLSSYVIWGMRTKVLCQSLEFNLSLSRAVEIVTSSTLVASLTPSSVGGEPLRVHLLTQDNMPAGTATAIVLGERLFDAMFILLLAPVALQFFSGYISSSGLNNVVLIGEGLVVFVLMIIVYVVLHPAYIKKTLHFLIHKIARFIDRSDNFHLESLLIKSEKIIDDFHSSITFLVTKGSKGLFFGSIYTLLFWIVEFAMIPVILIGLNQSPSIIISFAAQVLLMLLLVLPITPGSSGIAELGASSLFSVFTPAYMVGIVVVLWRLFTVYTNIVVGGFVSFKILKDTQYIKDFMK